MRPTLTKENAFPGQQKLEIGSIFQYTEFEERGEFFSVMDRDELMIEPYLRYGLLDNLTVIGRLPYTEIDRDFGDDDNGIGDASLGFELLVFEDIFEYPYVIPHLDVVFDTGDEDEGLGRGETTVKTGISVGTVVYDKYHYIVDAGYEINDDRDNIASLAGTFIWDVSEQFSVLGEAMISDEEVNEDNDHPSFYRAGLCYKATESLAINVYGGGAKNTDEDVSASVKVSYSF
jgi:hypothetical protein